MIHKWPFRGIVRRFVVKGWAGRYTAELAGKMGFAAEKNFDEIIKVYQEDEM